MSKELDDAYFRSTPCTHHEPLLSKLVDCVDLLEERIKGLLGANVYVGDTDTLPAGSEATVSASKHGYDTMLEFGIPRGDKGDPGEPGAPGAPGKDGSDATATDVRINGKSITVDGVADIPLASNTHIGLVKLWEYGGLVYGGAGLEIIPASEATISARNGSHYMIPADSRLDYAVKAAMCDGKGAAWTAAEQAAASKRLGLCGDFELIESYTMTQETQFSRSVTPSGKNYAFKKLFVIAYSDEASIPAWKTILPSLDGKSETKVTIDGLTMATYMYTLAASKKEYNAIYFDVSCGIFDMSVEAFNNEAYSSRSAIRKTIPKKFNAVTGFTVDRGGFPIGTKINIYGIWS